VPAGKLVHAILDNHGTHKHPKVLAWLARHPRWTFHFTPTSGWWLNAVETFFSALTRRRLRRGVFGSIVGLQAQAAIHRHIAEHNDAPPPFVWTRSSNQLVDKLDRLNESVH
jgi:transposase